MLIWSFSFIDVLPLKYLENYVYTHRAYWTNAVDRWYELQVCLHKHNCHRRLFHTKNLPLMLKQSCHMLRVYSYIKYKSMYKALQELSMSISAFIRHVLYILRASVCLVHARFVGYMMIKRCVSVARQRKHIHLKVCCYFFLGYSDSRRQCIGISRDTEILLLFPSQRTFIYYSDGMLA